VVQADFVPQVIAEIKGVTNLIVIDALSDEDKESATGAGMSVHSFQEVIDKGREVVEHTL